MSKVKFIIYPIIEILIIFLSSIPCLDHNIFVEIRKKGMISRHYLVMKLVLVILSIQLNYVQFCLKIIKENCKNGK